MKFLKWMVHAMFIICMSLIIFIVLAINVKRINMPVAPYSKEGVNHVIVSSSRSNDSIYLEGEEALKAIAALPNYRVLFLVPVGGWDYRVSIFYDGEESPGRQIITYRDDEELHQLVWHYFEELREQQLESDHEQQVFKLN